VLYPLSYEGGDVGPGAGTTVQPRIAAVPGATILVVDDDPVILERARAERPDLLILDVMMPRMNGIEVARALKSDPGTASIPILMLSAKAQAADVSAGGASGVDDYVTKPFDPEVLLGRAEGLIERSRR
jgi:DNA-binding response OmpR family regulator